jgi:hypothetical protein
MTAHTHNGSRLDTAQLELLPSSDQMDGAVFAEMEAGRPSRNPEFTGARLFATKPDVYRQIVSLRCVEKLPLRRVAEILGVSQNTVDAVEKRERASASVEAQKEEAAGEYRDLGRLARERARHELLNTEKIALRDLAVAGGIFDDKAQLLSGGATARVEFSRRDVADDDMSTFLQELRADADATRFGGALDVTKEVEVQGGAGDQAGAGDQGGAAAVAIGPGIGGELGVGAPGRVVDPVTAVEVRDDE